MSKPPSKPMTAKRQKILELAMAQLKKTRAQMDPNVLGKIRAIIASNPKVMKGLGLDKMPQDRDSHAPQAVLQEKTHGAPAPMSENKEPRSALARLSENKEEKIDQAHNQEVIAKLMQLKPAEIKNIKKILMNRN